MATREIGKQSRDLGEKPITSSLFKKTKRDAQGLYDYQTKKVNDLTSSYKYARYLN